jgi:dephospho-CoA kinase
MVLLGLTGGIGMGKSTAATLLLEQNIPVTDTDVLARQVVEPGQPALAEIALVFGKELIAPDGRLHRQLLAERAFADPERRAQLEAILHPRIRNLWQAQVRGWREEQRAIGVVVIPLLYETDATSQFDAVLCVACSSLTQRERLQPRGWTQAHLEQRLAAQWPIEKKIALADFVIWTEGALSVHAEQLKRILGEIRL